MKLIALIFALLSSSIMAAPKPVDAVIVDVPTERRDWHSPIGNVKVTFSDGHTEMWTKEGKCIHPKTSSTGLVGWTRYSERNAKDEPVNSTLRILVTESDIKDLAAGPYIEEWDFTDGDKSVVIKSRGRHGPANFVKYDINSAKVIDSVKTYLPYNELPDWAKPFSDDKPGQ